MNTTETTIAAALILAYQNASGLKISKQEKKELMKPFPDKEVEIAANGSIFIPHIYLSERLNQVFNPCAWSLVEVSKKINEDEGHVWADYILLVRKCYVGQASGEFKVDAMGGQGKVSDALEATKGSALRRICKQLSCGHELWKPEYIERWQSKFAETRAEGSEVVWQKKGAKVTFKEGSDAPTVKTKKPKANEELKHVMLECLKTQGASNVLQFALVKGILKPNQTLEDWPLESVAIGETEIRKLQLQVQEHFAPAQQALNWKTVKIPFGGAEGKALGECDKETVSGYWSSFTDKLFPSAVKKHPEFKIALEEAGRFYNFQDVKGKA